MAKKYYLLTIAHTGWFEEQRYKKIKIMGNYLLMHV